MLAFTCDNCGQLVFFDNTACLACLAPLGVIPGSGVITLQPDDHDPSRFRRFTDPEGIWWRRCVNASTTMCNWLVPDTERGDRCRSCELTRTLPDASAQGAILKDDVGAKGGDGHGEPQCLVAEAGGDASDEIEADKYPLDVPHLKAHTKVSSEINTTDLA